MRLLDSFISLVKFTNAEFDKYRVSGQSIIYPTTKKEFFDVYNEHFEVPFIEETEKYYRQESKAFLTSNSASAYLKKAEARLNEEEERLIRYLHSQTRKPLLSKCEEVLIMEHETTILDSLPEMMDFDRIEDLQRVYVLLSRIAGGLGRLKNRFEEHVEKTGLAAVANQVVGPSSTAEQLKAYVDALSDMCRKHSDIVTQSFRGEAGFVVSLNRACRRFVNRNDATQRSSARSAESLAKHADFLLRNGNKHGEGDVNDMEGPLNRVVCFHFQIVIFFTDSET